jgi:hypothetical protein
MAQIHFGRGVLFLALFFFVAHPKLLRASDSPTVTVTGAIFSGANNIRRMPTFNSIQTAQQACAQKNSALRQRRSY